MFAQLLDEIVAGLKASRGLRGKRDIASVVSRLGIADPKAAVPVGDDCAAIADGDTHLLLAIEGFINEFVAKDPWFAGWCGVMVNVSDVYAMGGRPMAVVDASWSADAAMQAQLLDGMAAASKTYGVPVVGGHSNLRSEREQLAVAILGRASKLLSSFAARPGDALIAVTDLRGAYRPPYPHWNAATDAPAARLRGDLEVLPRLAEDGLCAAAKDISQAGVLGTLLMLMECSGVGAQVELDSVPRPARVSWAHWLLSTFPSYGFLLAVKPQQVRKVLARFAARELAAARIGVCDDSRQLHLSLGGQRRLAWDFAVQPLMGCGAGAAPAASFTEESTHAGNAFPRALAG